MLERQAQHLLLLLVLLASVLVFVYVVLDESALAGQLWGIPTPVWFVIAIALPIVHQVYVWLVWRVELNYGGISRLFGERGFTYYAVGFTVLILGRPVSIVLLAWSNRGTLGLNPILAYSLAGLFLVLSFYTFYSVRKYFGLKRAFGIDHFDPAYRDMPFVREGMFRYSSNAMYVYGFLLLWTPGLILLSQAALVAAAFNHAYIWVHYYCTELPDIKRIYGTSTI